jgi:hypothetical protein
MKYFVIIFSLFFHSCNGQISEKKNTSKQINDTITTLLLNGKYYLNNSYEVVYLIDETENKMIYLNDKDGVIGIILLPKADDEIKNFSVDRILKTKRGFQINVNWGGGNYFYGREFYFYYRNNNFYLDTIKYNIYFERDNKTVNDLKIIKEPIVFSKFNILSYIVNE